MEAGIETAPQPYRGSVPSSFASAADAKLWLSERFADETDPLRLLGFALEAMGRFLGVSRVAYGELDAALEWMTVPLDWTDGVPSKTGRRAFERESAFARHYRAGRTLVVDDVLTATLEPEQIASFAKSGIRSVVGVPLIEGGQLVAVFNATHTAPRSWTEDEVVLFAQTGARIWSALQHVRMLDKLREGEEQFRTLAENMPGLCWLGGADGLPYWGNRRWAEFFTGTGGEFGDTSWIVHPDDRDRVMSAWTIALKTGTAMESTARIRGADGVFRPFLTSGTPIHDAAGKVIRWCGVLVDLSAQYAHDARQTLLRAFSDATRDQTDPSAILAAMGEMTAAHMGVGQVAYAEVTGDAAVFDVSVARAGGHFEELPAMFRFPEGAEMLLDDYRRGEPLVVCSYEDDLPPLTRSLITARQTAEMCAAITVPLVKDGRLMAMLIVSHPTPRRWSDDEIQLVEELADRVWSSVSRARAEAALAERERHQAFILDWSDRVRQLTEPQAIVDTTLERLGRHLGVTRATYAECDATGRRFTVTGEWRDGVASILGNSFLLESVGAHVDRAWTAGEIISYDDVAHDPRLEDAAVARYVAAEIGAFASIPLVRSGRMHSALSLQHAGPRVWHDREIELLRDIAERTWVALERAEAQAALGARERTQAFLLAWSDRVARKTDAQSILTETLAALGEHLGVDRANFAEATEDGLALCVRQQWVGGLSSIVDERYTLAALGKRLAAAHASGLPVRVDDVAADPLFDDGNRPLFDALGIAAVLTLPMIRLGKITAVLSIQQGTARHWTDAEVELVAEMANRTLAVLERARSEERLATSEAQLSAFLENAPVAMHLKGADGRYLRVNPEFARGLGRRRDEVEGKHPHELFPVEITRAIEQLDSIVKRGEVARTEISLESIAEGMHALAMVFPIADGAGPARSGGFTLDLTEQKKAEAALARSRDMLFQSEKLSALGSLLAGVSHELNNPLSIVVAQAVMMERKAAGGELADRAQKIRKAADRCARIVQTFLAMARQKRPERKATDLNAVAAAAQELADYGLTTDGVTTVREFASGLPLISADADQLHQVIINLLVNAQHAMVEAGGTERILTLRTATGASPGTVILEVSDTGPGVPDHARRRIFEPFFTTKPQGQGTGVGLSFSQGLAEAHGGRLELVPTARGACFRLTLPVEALHGRELAPETMLAEHASRRRALVVDDEHEIAEALADFLSAEGFTCILAEGGAAARAELAHGDYDLIVSDLRMPQVDGPALYAWIVRERPELAIRTGFATGDTLGAAAARFLAEAKRPVLEKPFTPDTVRRFLQQMDLP
jgi:PAS domain S-box-containing protein